MHYIFNCFEFENRVFDSMKALSQETKHIKRLVFARFQSFYFAKKLIMKESFYFPHDNNAHNDPKLMWLLMSMWLASIGLYWVIIEIMHQQEDWIINEEEFKNYIQFYSMKQNSTFVEQVFNKFQTLEIFCFEDWKVFSKRVLKNKEFRSNLKEKRSNAWKKSAEIRALKREESTSVQQNSTSVQQNFNNEKEKEKKKKVNKKEIKHKYWEYLNVLITNKQKEKFIEDFWEDIFYKYIKTVDEYIQVTWKVYKDHNLVMRKFKNNDKDKTWLSTERREEKVVNNAKDTWVVLAPKWF